jgi:hypothetical protein
MTPRRLAMTVALGLAGAGCATAGPVGGRAALAEGYEPFARAAPRATPATVGAEAPTGLSVRPGARQDAVAEAQRLVGRKRIEVNGKRFGDDCTGLVRAVFEPLGIDLLSRAQPGDNGVTAMWRFASAHGRVFHGGRPLPGDLVFFKDTYDVNRDGRIDDGLTHIGLVEDVEADGTVVVIHRVARGVVRYRMNLATPTQARGADGRKLNDWLRTEAPGARPRLTAELFAGFATILPVEPRFATRE